MTRQAEIVVNSYRQFLMYNQEMDFSKIGYPLCPIPRFTFETIRKIVNQFINVVRGFPTLLEIENECIIAGDLHGNLNDLLRILATNGLPKANQHNDQSDQRDIKNPSYLFLGDYVDRGDYSIEVVTLLFSLQILYPDSIFILRGNHEFRETNEKYGFLEQIKTQYEQVADDMFELFNSAFDILPLAAVVGRSLFCVHGGLSSALTNVGNINRFTRPITDYNHSKIINDLMWSDPTSESESFIPNTRGKGCAFGSFVALNFLKANNLQKIIRGHQFVQEGVSTNFSDRLITVFSSSNYQSVGGNKCGILYAIPAKQQSFDPRIDEPRLPLQMPQINPQQSNIPLGAISSHNSFHQNRNKINPSQTILVTSSFNLNLPNQFPSTAESDSQNFPKISSYGSATGTLCLSYGGGQCSVRKRLYDSLGPTLGQKAHYINADQGECVAMSKSNCFKSVYHSTKIPFHARGAVNKSQQVFRTGASIAPSRSLMSKNFSPPLKIPKTFG